MELIKGIKNPQCGINECDGLRLKDGSKWWRVIDYRSELFNEGAESGDDPWVGEPVMGNAVVKHLEDTGRGGDNGEDCGSGGGVF